MRMTPAMVAARVGEIDREKDDDESAHVLEDKLYRELLEAIAKGHLNYPAACAIEALKSQDIDFARWCA